MNFRTTLVLLVVCVVLGGYVFWSGRSEPASPVASTTTTPVVQINSAEVDTLIVRDAQGTQVRVERTGADWKLTEPEAGAADTAGVTSAIGSLATLSATQVITPPSQDLAPYGLATPLYTIQLSKGQTSLTELLVGSKNPSGNATYVQPVGGKHVYLVSDPSVNTIVEWLHAPPVQPTPLPTLPPAFAEPSVVPNTTSTAMP